MGDNNSLHWEDISLVCLLRRLAKELPAIIAAAAIAAMLSVAGIKLFYVPQYTATATVAVGLKNASYTSILSNLSGTAEIAGTFTKLFESEMFSVISKEKLGVEKLNGKLETAVVQETNLMTMRVTSSDPEEAFKTLRFLLDNYSAVSDYVFQNVVLRELDPPSVPRTPSNSPDITATVKRAALIGASTMAALIILAELLADRLQTSSAVRRKVDAKLYGTIHHETKNKTLRTKLRHKIKGLLLTNPTASFNFSEEMAKLASRVAHAAKREDKNIILITSVAENEGKSTVAANLAIALARKGANVLLLDADMHKPAQYKLLDVGVKTELADIISGKAEVESEYLPNHGISAIFSLSPRADAAELIASDSMRSLIREFSEAADYTIIDSPPMDAFSDAETLADIAGLSLLVVRQDRVSTAKINDAVDVLKQCSAKLLGCVFNDVRVTPVIGSRSGYGYGHSRGYGYGYGYGERDARLRTEDNHGTKE